VKELETLKGLGWLTVEQRNALTRAFVLLCDDDRDNSFARTIKKMLANGVEEVTE
jgi:hypothetical protein